MIATFVAVGSLAVLLLLVWAFQRCLIYFPGGDAPPAASSVFERGEDVELQTTDGLELGVWLALPPGDGPHPTVIVFNGNAGNRWNREPLAQALIERGLAVLSVDYRGYAGNPGDATEKGLITDANAARSFVGRDARLDADRVAYFGESLGAAVALALAVEQPPAALVLRSPFTTLNDIARLHYPYLPAGPLLMDTYPSIDRIAELTAPLLVVAGGLDRLVPAEQSRKLFDAATGPKEFVLVDEADHNSRDLLDGARMLAAMTELFIEAGVLPGGDDAGGE